MKKISLLILFIFLTKFSSSQDFNLFNPSNEMYLFSAYDEGANAFRYNPAVLGLGHRLNASVNVLLENYRGKIKANEIDIAINSGSLGLAYRNTTIYRSNFITRPPYNDVTNNFSLGIGTGNKTITMGILLEYITNQITKDASYFDTPKNRFRAGLGFLYRPSDFMSMSFVLRNNKSLSQFSYLGNNFTTGIGVRPFKNNLLTLLFDFNFIPYVNTNIFEVNSYKIGLSAKPLKGIIINGNYTKINGYTKSSFVNLGLQFDLPHFSIGYNNVINKIQNSSRYKFVGSNISLTYSLEKKESIIKEPKKILEISLSGSLQDYNTEDVFFGLLGQGKRSVHEVIADIDYAAEDESISGLLLKIYPLSTGKFEVNANIEELGAAMERFKKKGKTITAYLTQSTGPGEYYLATYANNIILPDETFLFYGLSIDVNNYKSFLAKYGIDLNTFYAGKYKLTFQGLLDSTSEEGKEVINRILDVVYEKMINRVTVSRKIKMDDYMREKLSMPISGIEAKRLGLIDMNGWYDDAKDIAIRNSGTDKVITTLNRKEWDNDWSEPDAIAIVGVYGNITTGESQPPSPIQLPIPFIGGGRSTGSESVVRQLEDAFANPRVKAVILRVDSGGGDATASAEINAAVIRLKKKYKKPFIVSMGGAAASGGYFVSTSADKIFADDLTISGSIGVFYVKPNIDSLLEKQRIKIQTFSRGEHSDMETISRKPTKEEIEIIQGLVNYSYDNFITAVSKGRNMTKEEVDAVAQGRVWLGTDAFNKNLVDEIGGLKEAVSYAKKKSGIEKRMKLIYYAVPSGNVVNQLVTSSVINYLQTSILKALDFDDDNKGIDIKY